MEAHNRKNIVLIQKQVKYTNDIKIYLQEVLIQEVLQYQRDLKKTEMIYQ